MSTQREHIVWGQRSHKYRNSWSLEPSRQTRHHCKTCGLVIYKIWGKYLPHCDLTAPHKLPSHPSHLSHPPRLLPSPSQNRLVHRQIRVEIHAGRRIEVEQRHIVDGYTLGG